MLLYYHTRIPLSTECAYGILLLIRKLLQNYNVYDTIFTVKERRRLFQPQLKGVVCMTDMVLLIILLVVILEVVKYIKK